MSTKPPPRPGRSFILSSGVTRRLTLSGAAAAATVAGANATAAAFPRPRDRRYEVLEVGPGRRFRSLTLAACFMNSEQRWANGYAPASRRAEMGFRVIVSPGPPGYYTNDSGSHSRRWSELVGWPPFDGNLLGPVIVEGEAGKPAPLLDTDGYGDGVLYYQKGLFNTGDFDATFRRLEFRGFRRRDGNGNYAALRIGEQTTPGLQRATITVEDCDISGCDNGIMGSGAGQRVVMRRCHIHDNGNATGRAHNIYVGMADELVIEDLLSTRCTIGHLLKTRAHATVIRRSRLLGSSGSESACLDAPNGGVLDLEDVVCEKSPDSDARWIVHYAGENQDAAGMPFHVNSSIRLRNLIMVAPERLTRRPSTSVYGFANMSGAGFATSGRDSRFIAPDAQSVWAYGMKAPAVGLPAVLLRSRPALDLRPPVRL